MSFIIRVNRGLKDINMTAHTEQYVDRMVELPHESGTRLARIRNDGLQVINPDAVMARKPEEVEAAIELARAAGVSEALLERMGGYTGCVGVLDTGRPGPVTTLRFDIDCLAIEELFDANKLDQKTLEATFARYNELTQPARTPTSAAASTRKQSRSAKRPSTSPK